MNAPDFQLTHGDPLEPRNVENIELPKSWWRALEDQAKVVDKSLGESISELLMRAGYNGSGAPANGAAAAPQRKRRTPKTEPR